MGMNELTYSLYHQIFKGWMYLGTLLPIPSLNDIHLNFFF